MKVLQVEKAIVEGILSGKYPVGGALPLEGELCEMLGVSRTALREALKRLESFGFITSTRGKPSRVRDFWKEGNLLTLAKVVEYWEDMPSDFVVHFMELRVGFLPVMAAKAVERVPEKVVSLVAGWSELSKKDFVDFDWGLHRGLAELSGNPVSLLLVNSFEVLYRRFAPLYFELPGACDASLRFYRELIDAAMARDGMRAHEVTKEAMEESIRIWRSRK